MSDADLTERFLAERFLAELRSDRGRFAALDQQPGAVDLTASVAACPGWDVATLLVHLGRVHRWAAGRVLLDPDSDDMSFPPRPAQDIPLIAWLTDGLDSLIEVLSTTDLDASCWSFMGPSTRRWWLRRQAIETAIHRWDAQGAVSGPPDAVGGEVAAAGVSEWCEFAAGGGFRPVEGVTGSVHLHATDGDGEWIIEVSSDSFAWREGHEKGDVALRATRSDLLLILWNRVPRQTAEVFGDRVLLDRVIAAAAR